ncbi:ATP-binding protein [Micropruina sp.]|uniref:ATP-binding protein n=1 Tax=Micropruina sp. TaxID=2737536 RepID=UPI0039E31A5D
MLGEQLIKNDRVALAELVKNSYDADATRVEIRFEDFGPGWKNDGNSRITITDNGVGMTLDVVRDHWLNPATDVKARQKRKKDGAKTPGGRIIQGEKGIGRFAMFKLGSEVHLVTRAAGDAREVTTSVDIAFLDEGAGDESEIQFLDELELEVATRSPEVFTGRDGSSTEGTQLSITGLRSNWTEQSLKDLHQALLRLRPLRQLLTGQAGADPLSFDIEYLVNGERPSGLDDPDELLENAAEHAVLQVVGEYLSASNSFKLTINNEDRSVPLDSTDILALKLYERATGGKAGRQFNCGDFSFELLVFDLRPVADARYHLNPQDVELVKGHRIYLYRDGVRVLPYGDPDDDWLQLDAIRGTVKADRLLSNDQTIGFVYITQEGNSGLRDKTSREGLIDSGVAYRDFIGLLQLVISYLRAHDFSRYLAGSNRRVEATSRRAIGTIDRRIAAVRKAVKGDSAAQRAFADFEKVYRIERAFMQSRVTRSEDLAGVGLSVETASHDVIASSNQAYQDMALLMQQLVAEFGVDHEITSRADRLSESISFIVSRLQDVQGLFVSSRRRARQLDVVQYIKKIESIYSRTLRSSEIQFILTGDSSFVVKAHEATLLQIFLNLVDNAVFWLNKSSIESPIIKVHIDAAEGMAVFEDNGVGISKLDVPFIFEPFFSTKGDEGRGLGLYIAGQVAARDGFELDLVQEGSTTRRDRVPAQFRLRTKP